MDKRMTPETENVIPRGITLSSTQVRVCRHHGVIFSAITTGPLSSSQGRHHTAAFPLIRSLEPRPPS